MWRLIEDIKGDTGYRKGGLKDTIIELLRSRTQCNKVATLLINKLLSLLRVGVNF